LDRPGGDVLGSRAGGVRLRLSALASHLGAGLVACASRLARRRDPRHRGYPVVGQSLCVQQPCVNNPPFVLPPRLEIQQWRLLVLEFVGEPPLLLSVRSARIDRWRQNPLVPLLQDQPPCFALFHRRVFPPTGKTVE